MKIILIVDRSDISLAFKGVQLDSKLLESQHFNDEVRIKWNQSNEVIFLDSDNKVYNLKK